MFSIRPAFVLILAALGLFWWAGAANRPAQTPKTARAETTSHQAEGKLAALSPAEASETEAVDEAGSNNLSRVTALDQALKRLDQFPADEKRAALRFAQSIAPQFPETGVRAEARSAKEITLLVDLNRMPEARALVREFIQVHPDSRYRPLVQGVTGIHPRPTGPSP